MIQRIQTLFLLAVAICAGLGMIFPTVALESGDQLLLVKAFTTTLNGEAYGASPLGYLAIAVIVIAAASILLFKNRGQQIRLCKFNLVLISLFLAASVFLSELLLDKNDPIFKEVIAHFKIGVAMPFLALIFNYLAIRFIKKDEKLVRAADRLR